MSKRKTEKDPIRDAQMLADTACDVMHEMFRSWSVDELLVHPEDAIELCDVVRRKAGRKASNYEICKALLNARKRGYLGRDVA